VVHIWHNKEFTTLCMSARYKDSNGNIQKIDNQSLFEVCNSG